MNLCFPAGWKEGDCRNRDGCGQWYILFQFIQEDVFIHKEIYVFNVTIKPLMSKSKAKY